MEQYRDRIFKGLIWSFLGLYSLVAGISMYHCVEFCMVGNPMVLSVMMSFAFEVGLALTLFSILINEGKKSNFVSWTLMTLLTCVQVMGNIYSVEKYMETSGNNFYVYIQNGFLHWFTDDMPVNDVMSIIAIILGALLPFVALLMTSMVAGNWKEHMRRKLEAKTETEIEPKETEDTKETEEKTEETKESEETEETEEKAAPEPKADDEPKSDDSDMEEPKVAETVATEPFPQMKDGSLLTDAEHDEMERVTFSQPTSQGLYGRPRPTQPPINFFRPLGT